MTDHIKYIEEFISSRNLENITFVIHDWGSFFGFHYAMRHPENVKGLAFMEAILLPVLGYDALDDDLREFFQNLAIIAGSSKEHDGREESLHRRRTTGRH